MLDGNNNSVDDLPIALSFGKILAADLSPIDLRAVENVESMRIIDLYLLRDIGALDDGSIISVASLDKIDALIKAMILVHYVIYILIGTQRITNKS
jgi:hypothetical protein